MSTKNIICLVFFAVVFVNASIAQIFGPKRDGINSFQVGSFSTALIIPSAYGDNFVANGANLKGGIHNSFKLNIYRGIEIGLRGDYFGLSINDTQFSGNYTRSNIASYGIFVGYRFLNTSQYSVAVFGGFGEVNYTNNRAGIRGFKDSGTLNFINLDAELKLNKYFKLFVAPELRFDKLNTAAQASVSDQLNNIHYFTVNVGLRVSFWNNEVEEDEDEDEG